MANPSTPIRFACQPGCTACCTQKGFVYLTEDDLTRAAAFLGLSPAAFEARYVYRTKHLRRLRKPRHAACHFLEGNACAIHTVKPTHCRTFPFWPELLEDRTEWKKAMAFCPGIGQGGFVPVESVRRQAEETRRAYPTMY